MPKYLHRLLIFSLLLSVVPVVCIGIISYFIASKDIEQKVNESNAQILLQNQMRIEQMLRVVEMGAVQYINSPLGSNFIDHNFHQDDFQTITQLTKGLYNLHSIAGVADTYLINLEHNWMISKLGFTASDDFPRQDVLKEYASRPKNLFWLAEGNRNLPVGAPEEEAYDESLVRLVIKIPMISQATPKALLIIDMSQSALTGSLTQNPQLGSVYVLNREQKPFLSSSGFDGVQQSILQQLGQAEEAAGYFEQDKMAVNYRLSAYNDWSYVSVVSIADIVRETGKIAFITLNACFIIFSLVAVAAFYGTRRMYRPIRRLFTIMEQLGGEAAASPKRDEFAFIEDRFQSLFSTRTHLQQQLQMHRGQIKEFLLLKLIMGQVTESEFSYKAETYGFVERGKALGMLALQIDSMEGPRYMESDRELLLFAINNVVGELFHNERILGTLLLDQSQVTVLLGDSDNPEELRCYFNQMAELVQSKVHELFQLKVSIGISRPFYRYTDAMNAYSESLEALKRRISLGNGLILNYDDLETVHNQLPASSWSHFEESISNSLKTGDEASAYECFNQYVSSILEKDITFNDFQIMILQLITKIYHIVQQQGGNLDELLSSKSVISRFMKLNTAEEISVWFKAELLPPTIAFLKERLDNQYMNIAQRMIELIHVNYHQDITLESCAEQFKYHPVYLSRVFKKEVGVTFIDYLTNYRTNMAKMWLKDSDMKITEIAERLNYSNSTGFIRTFRKATGMTPGQYRKYMEK